MPEDNKALVGSWIQEVLTWGNLEAVEELFARGYVLHDPNFPRDVHDPEGIERYVAAYRAAFPDVRFAVEDQLAEGDTVVTRWTARGTHLGEFLGVAPSGDEVTVSGIEFDRVVGGRIDEAWVGYHPFAGPAPDPEQVGRGLAAVREAFPDLRMAEADRAREGEKVAFRWVMTGTHEGEFRGRRAHRRADRGDGHGHRARGRRGDSRAPGRVRRHRPAQATGRHTTALVRTPRPRRR